MRQIQPIPDSKSLQSLVERFHRAKWTDGLSIVSDGNDDPYRMDVTLHGQFRLRQLFTAFNGATTENFPDASDFNTAEAGRIIMSHFFDAMFDLCPPHLTTGEKVTLLGFTLAFAKRQLW